VKLFDEISDRIGTAEALEAVAVLARCCGDFVRAGQLCGAADALRDRVSSSIDVPHRLERDATLARVRAAVGEAGAAAAWADGRAMPLERAVAEALEVPPNAGPTHPVVTESPGDGLTRREWEVATLVAEGLSNKEIAGRLVISERTVETHVSSILGKLDFSSRSQVAIWVVERQGSRPRV
jgi:non-specific serine/threonine protein kinase